MKRFLLAFLLASSVGFSQNPGIPVYKEGQGTRPDAALRKALQELRTSKALPMGMEQVAAQLSRTSCNLKLAEPSHKTLTARERWTLARNNHLRVGWYYKAPKMLQWQINLAGGFAITEAGAVATCFHVVVPMHHEMREGFLFAVDDEDHIFPVTEILAASQETDCCIIKVKADKLWPLPLGSDIQPGDTVSCFSEPMGHRGFYSEGIVNRFLQRNVIGSGPKRRDKSKGKSEAPRWLEASTDWAPGSSGSAVLDQFGNIVAHVSEIESVPEDQPDPQKEQHLIIPGTVIIFHDAILSKHVRDLVKQD
jgi:hypothetical protein